MDNLPQLLAQELRSRGNKSVKSVLYNAADHTLSVYPVGYPEKPSFNYPVPNPLILEDLADEIEARCGGAPSAGITPGGEPDVKDLGFTMRRLGE